MNLSLNAQAHDYGVDGTFHQVTIRPQTSGAGILANRRLNSGFSLDFQCKASTDWTEEPQYIVYDLEAKTYNDLVFRAVRQSNATPLILILMCLPKEEADWLVLSEAELLLRKCCYWHRLTGAETGNEYTKRIRIAKSQRLELQR